MWTVFISMWVGSHMLLQAHPGDTDDQFGHINPINGKYHIHPPTQKTSPKSAAERRKWQRAFNSKILRGRLDQQVKGKKIDILSRTHAVDVDWIQNWETGVLDALDFADVTGKKAGMAVILEDITSENEKLEECKKVCKGMGIELWVINDFVNADDL